MRRAASWSPTDHPERGFPGANGVAQPPPPRIAACPAASAPTAPSGAAMPARTNADCILCCSASAKLRYDASKQASITENAPSATCAPATAERGLGDSAVRPARKRVARHPSQNPGPPRAPAKVGNPRSARESEPLLSSHQHTACVGTAQVRAGRDGAGERDYLHAWQEEDGVQGDGSNVGVQVLPDSAVQEVRPGFGGIDGTWQGLGPLGHPDHRDPPHHSNGARAAHYDCCMRAAMWEGRMFV